MSMIDRSPSEYAAAARAWLAEHAPLHGAPRKASGGTGEPPIDEQCAFQAALADAGFAGISWPVEFGGQGLSQEHQNAFAEVVAEFDLPTTALTIGLGMCAPTLLACGSQSQQRDHVANVIAGREVWCQLFSEPGAGSDVASLVTAAEQIDGGSWRITGQKIWSSYAHYAHFGLLLARTDPEQPKHQGLSMFVVDMHDPAITVRRIRMASGESHFNEVFFDGVELPASALIGEVNGGWAVARITLASERVTIGTSRRPGRNPIGSESLLQLACRNGRLSPEVLRSLAELHLLETSVSALGTMLSDQQREGADLGARGAVAKLAAARLAAGGGRTAATVLGETVLGYDDPESAEVIHALLEAPSRSIGGGTNEMLRNIIAERVLGLPKDPGIERSIPFRELRVNSNGIQGGNQ